MNFSSFEYIVTEIAETETLEYNCPERILNGALGSTLAVGGWQQRRCCHGDGATPALASESQISRGVASESKKKP